jgi:hypothetical protein
VGCPSCRRKLDFNKFITSVQVNLGVDSVPGSASISMSIPRHTVDDFYFDGIPVVTPMMEVEIYAKGFYLVEGLPQYYPIFWGLITEVSDNYSSGEHTVDIQCSDILKWWELCRVNVNAAFTAPTPNNGRNIYGNTFFGTNPYDVIWTLAQQSFGDIVVGTGSLNSFYKEAEQANVFQSLNTDMMLYWENRFRRIRSNLMLYGINGVAVRGATLSEGIRDENGNHKHLASTQVSLANGGKDAGQVIFDPTNENITAFRTQFGNAGQVNFWQSEYQTKLELANASKEAIGFEFFMDVTGDIVFKPPFFNLDILSNKPLSWIQDIDIIDWGFSESEAEVVTQITMQGSFGGNVEYGLSEEATPYSTVTDYHLLRKYGWRVEPYNSEFMGNPQDMFYHGLDILDRKNSRRHHGTVTIPLRPELRLGFPVYIAPKDQIWYVTGINHNIAFGGRATTQLTLTAKREKFKAPKGISRLTYKGRGAKGSTKLIPSRQLAKSGSYELNGEFASIPTLKDISPGQYNPYEPLIMRHPKTGRIVGYPNAVMVYTRPFEPPTSEVAKRQGVSDTGQKKAVVKKGEPEKIRKNQTENLEKQVKDSKVTDKDRLQQKHSNNRYQYGMNSAGVYVYAYDSSGTIGELALIPGSNIKVKSQDNSVKPIVGGSGLVRPVSDERGFEVIGHFRYGRGIALRDGQLVLSNGGRNQRASVDVQLALGGGLTETLAAQSQGITAVTSSYANPAFAVARMVPADDLQTAGFINPETKEPEFTPGKETFAETAPLGSLAQIGLPASVEATQLSRALTITEMRAKDADIQEESDCACVTGRADLAFINVGYQVKTLNNAAGASPLNIPSLDDPTSSTSLTKPVVQPSTLPAQDAVMQKVETFLWDLYSKLDPAHRREETILRYGVAEPEKEPNEATGPNTQPFGELSPPFSAPGRYAIGDKNAFIGQIDSAVKGLDKAFSNFGTSMKSNVKKAELSQKVANEQGDIARLEAEKASLQQQVNNGAEAVAGPSLQDQIKRIDEQLARRKQDLANDQAALNQLGTG